MLGDHKLVVPRDVAVSVAAFRFDQSSSNRGVEVNTYAALTLTLDLFPIPAGDHHAEVMKGSPAQARLLRALASLTHTGRCEPFMLNTVCLLGQGGWLCVGEGLNAEQQPDVAKKVLDPPRVVELFGLVTEWAAREVHHSRPIGAFLSEREYQENERYWNGRSAEDDDDA